MSLPASQRASLLTCSRKAFEGGGTLGWQTNATVRCGGETGSIGICPESHKGPGSPGEAVRQLQSGPQLPSGRLRSPQDEDVCSFTFPERCTLPGGPDLPKRFLHEPHLPLHLLRDLFNPQLVVLRQELQLLVNKPQPLLPLFPHLQAVDPGRKHAGFRSGSPPSQGARKPVCAPAGGPAVSGGAQKHALPVPRPQPCALRASSLEEEVVGQEGAVGAGCG